MSSCIENHGAKRAKSRAFCCPSHVWYELNVVCDLVPPSRCHSSHFWPGRTSCCRSAAESLLLDVCACVCAGVCVCVCVGGV